MEMNSYDGIADLYDIYVPVEHDISFFLDVTRNINGPVLELMAGTGRVSIPLIEAGVDLTCEDSSKEMLNILEEKLKSRNLKARLINDDVCSLDIEERFKAVIIPFNSFAHLITPGEQKEALNRIKTHLVPEGILICTLNNPDIRKAHIDGNLHLYRKYSIPETGGSLLLWIMESFSPDYADVVETTEFFEEYDRSGTMVRKRMMDIKFRLTDRDVFESMARDAGFYVKSFWGDFDHSVFDPERSQQMIWIFGT